MPCEAKYSLSITHPRIWATKLLKNCETRKRLRKKQPKIWKQTEIICNFASTNNYSHEERTAFLAIFGLFDLRRRTSHESHYPGFPSRSQRVPCRQRFLLGELLVPVFPRRAHLPLMRPAVVAAHRQCARPPVAAAAERRYLMAGHLCAYDPIS